MKTLHDQLVDKVESMKDILDAKRKEIVFPPLENVKMTEEMIEGLRKDLESMYQCIKCHKKLPSGEYKCLCYSCQQEHDENEKNKWLNNHRCDHTTEERLRILESWMYDHQRAKHQSPFDFVMRG